MNEFPKRVTLELTNDCNLSCDMCPRQYMTDPLGYMTEDLWTKLVDECFRRQATIVPFWRGESLLHPRFNEYIEYALKRKLRIQFATNGHFISESNVPVITQFEFVSVSVHNLPAVNKLKILLNNRLGTRPIVQASFVESEKTVQLLSRVKGLADQVRVYRKHTLNGVFGKSDARLRGRKFCQKLMTDFVIAYDGSTSRCCYVLETDKTLNVTNKSIAEAWNHPSRRKIAEQYPDAICNQCDQWKGETLGEHYTRSLAQIA